MKYLSIQSHGFDSDFVRAKLESTCEKLKNEGYEIVNCQYINIYHIVVFYTK